MPSIQNNHVTFTIDPLTGEWVLTSKAFPGTLLKSGSPQVKLRIAETEKTVSLQPQSEISINSIALDPHGKAELLRYELSEPDRVHFAVEIALPEESSLLLIRLSVNNQSTNAIKQESFQLLDSAQIQFSSKQPDLGWYVNGWQSWSYSGTYSSEEKTIVSHLSKFMLPKIYDAATPVNTHAGSYASDMFGAIIDRASTTCLLAGFLSQLHHFGHLEMKSEPHPSLKVIASGDGATILPQTQVQTDWLAVGFLDQNLPDPFGEYLIASALENKVTIQDHVPSGWCSWYHFFTKITPEIILENIQELSKIKAALPLDLIQIDDGFQRAVGDWLECKPAFSGRMPELAEEIKENGYQAGIWLAPFMVHPASHLYQQHPDWMIHQADGKPTNAGWNWNRFCTGLDITHPDAQAYIREVIRTSVNSWGYNYLKLDFLYAAALPGKHFDETLTRAQILRMGMELIREEAGPDTYILGCGAPLGPMLGIVDGMRISTDVAPDWEPKFMGIELLFPNEPDIPSAKDALQNVLSRSMLHQAWWNNDPDCLLLRESTHLTLAEVQSLASLIALSGGLLLVSDDMASISQYRLRIAQSMLPIHPAKPQVLDWADRLTPSKVRQDYQGAAGEWHVISWTNWSNKPVSKVIDIRDYKLPPASDWVFRDYWTEAIFTSPDGKIEVRVPPHGTAMLAARRLAPNYAQYLGGNIHITQGIEVNRWVASQAGVDFTLSLPREVSGIVEVYLPQSIATITSEHGPISYHQTAEHIFQLQVSFTGSMQISILYS